MNTLEIKKVSKHFGGVKALNGCDFTIEKGKITALIGPNGSGKTTLFNCISKLYDIDSGKITFNGTNITRMRDFAVARLGISRTFQQVRLFKYLTIKQHLEIALGRTDEKMCRSYFRQKQNYSARIKEVLELVGLEKSITTVVSDLSYGQRKLLDLAIAIAKPHELLLLDEPVAGVNPELRKKIKEIIRKLNEQGETILLIEHDMHFVMNLVDEIFVIDQGAIIANGKPKEIQHNKKVLRAYLGE